MKKFFKALALVLALTLIVGVVPAQTADAAVKKAKTIFVGGANGKNADGTVVSKISNKVAIYKLAGYKAADKEGHKFAAELAAGETAGIVKITKNYVVAQKLGTVNVDIYVDGEKTGTTTIYSKVNATNDTLTLVDADGKEYKDGQEFVVGGTYTFKLPRAGKDSDERRLFINDKAVAETAKARVYEYKFAKSEEGDVTIKFEAFQGDKAGKLNGATASKEIKGKVVPPTAVSVKQTASDAFTLTFDQDIEAGDYYKDLKDWEVTDGIANDIYYKVSDVKVPFSSVKATSRDKKELTVTMFGNFVPDTTYFVDIAGKTFEFKAAGNGAKDVAAIVFTKNTATVDTDAALGYKLLNSIGVDITKTAEYAMNGSLEFTTESTVASLDNAGRTIYFGTVGDKAVVKATYTFYDPEDNYTAKPTVQTVEITAIAGSSTEFVSADYSIGAAVSKAVHTLKLGDATVVVNVNAKFRNGSNTYTYHLGEAPFGNNTELKVKVADEHYAMSTDDSHIEGVNTGKTYLLLYYTNANGDDVVITTLPFEVVAARKATSIVATMTDYYSGTNCLNTEDGAGDQYKFVVTVKDQYGDKLPANGIEVELRNGAPTDSGLDENLNNAGLSFQTNTNNIGDVTDLLTSATAGVEAEKSVAFTVKANNLTTVVSFKVKAVDAHSGATLSVGSSANGMDTALVNYATSGNCDDITLTVNEMSGSYWTGLSDVYFTHLGISNTGKDIDEYVAAVTPTGTAVVATIKYSGTTLPTSADNLSITTKNITVNQKYGVVVDLANHFANDGAGTVTMSTYDAGNDNKIPGGTYTVAFYKLTDTTAGDHKLTSWKSIGTKALVISDSQVLPEKTQELQAITTDVSTLAGVAPTIGNATAIAAVQEAYKFTWNGVELDDNCVVGVDYKVSSDGRLYVYSALINVKAALLESGNIYANGTAADYNFVVKIGELLN